jgi:hypothetical protein
MDFAIEGSDSGDGAVGDGMGLADQCDRLGNEGTGGMPLAANTDPDWGWESRVSFWKTPSQVQPLRSNRHPS